MNGLLERFRRLFTLRKRCQPPNAPTGVDASPGGGSMEVVLTWDPVTNVPVAHYKVYRRTSKGTYYPLAMVTPKALGLLQPGRLGIVDAPDYWPWPSGGDPSAERCYAVSAVSTHGLEGPMSALVCASPL